MVKINWRRFCFRAVFANPISDHFFGPFSELETSGELHICFAAVFDRIRRHTFASVFWMRLTNGLTVAWLRRCGCRPRTPNECRVEARLPTLTDLWQSNFLLLRRQQFGRMHFSGRHLGRRNIRAGALLQHDLEKSRCAVARWITSLIPELVTEQDTAGALPAKNRRQTTKAQNYLASVVLTYQDVSDDELRQYLWAVTENAKFWFDFFSDDSYSWVFILFYFFQLFRR